MWMNAVFCLAILFFPPSFCLASFISIDTAVSVSVNDGLAAIDCKVTNNGDEPAHQVEIEADFMGKKLVSPPVAMIPAGGTITQEFTFSPETKYSRMVVPLTIRYKDANQYAFSAISYASIKFEADESPGIFCKFEDLRMSGKGTLSLKIKSLDQNTHNITVRVVAPQELTVSDPIKVLSVPAGTTVSDEFEIKNFSALPPSTYTVIAIVSEERKTGRYDDAFIGKVSVIPEKQRFDFLSHPYLIWAIAGLILLYIAYQLFHLIIKKRSDEIKR